MAKVVIADDHKMLRQGLRFLLEAESDLEIIGEAATGDEAVEMLHTLCPEVLVADLRMPGLNGIELTKKAKEVCPETITVILSMYNNRAYADEALGAGARGYVLKDSSYEELVVAIRNALAGDCYVSPAIGSAGSK